MNTNLLIKYLEGNSTQEEKEAIAKWLDEDKKNMKEFLSLRKSYDLTLFNLKDSTPGKEVFKNKKTHFLYELLKIAAIFIFSFGVFQLFNFVNNEIDDEIGMHKLHVPAGQRAEITLADGTNVWLNAKTTLTYPTRFSGSTREVKLDGEAYFTVKHDPENPFIVETENYKINVLGTEFNVSAYSSNNIFETSLLKGSIEISSLQSDKKITLTPQNMVYLMNGELLKSRIDDYDHFLWRKGILYFNNEPMKNIISKLELYYDVKIVVKNNRILNFPYTGKFWIKDGIEHVVKVLMIHANFNFEKDNDKNIITIY